MYASSETLTAPNPSLTISVISSFRHSRVGGNPYYEMDLRLRGGDGLLVLCIAQREGPSGIERTRTGQRAWKQWILNHV
jgi:hypothetical protein